jgi:prepilin-type processing-associated H-X9-DG protein/prepilin-type N-terminal cleavage/methylation domain-containing protein
MGRRRPCLRSATPAFTLIELLVVLAIAAMWADDNWWLKSAAAGYAQGEPGFNRLLQDDYGCRRHTGAANYVFADGHAQRYNANDLRCDEVECWWSPQLNVHRPAVHTAASR